MDQKTAYEILGVSSTANAGEIKKAYKALVRQVHPDINSHPDATEAMRAVNEAYVTLKKSPEICDNINDYFAATNQEYGRARSILIKQQKYSKDMMISGAAGMVNIAISTSALEELIEGNSVAGLGVIVFGFATGVSLNIFRKSRKAYEKCHREFMDSVSG